MISEENKIKHGSGTRTYSRILRRTIMQKFKTAVGKDSLDFCKPTKGKYDKL